MEDNDNSRICIVPDCGRALRTGRKYCHIHRSLQYLPKPAKENVPQGLMTGDHTGFFTILFLVFMIFSAFAVYVLGFKWLATVIGVYDGSYLLTVPIVLGIFALFCFFTKKKSFTGISLFSNLVFLSVAWFIRWWATLDILSFVSIAFNIILSVIVLVNYFEHAKSASIDSKPQDIFNKIACYLHLKLAR